MAYKRLCPRSFLTGATECNRCSGDCAIAKILPNPWKSCLPFTPRRGFLRTDFRMPRTARAILGSALSSARPCQKYFSAIFSRGLTPGNLPSIIRQRCCAAMDYGIHCGRMGRVAAQGGSFTTSPDSAPSPPECDSGSRHAELSGLTSCSTTCIGGLYTKSA
jgi:hypothetical protein